MYEQYGIQEYIMVDSIQFNAEVYASEERYFVQKQKASTPESLKSVLLPGIIIDLISFSNSFPGLQFLRILHLVIFKPCLTAANL